jgi:phosphomannomutase
MQEPIISVSGLRGVLGESLTPEIALRYACAFARQMPPGAIVLTQDGRESGPLLADALRSGLAAVGREVLDAGVAATPTTGVLVREQGAAGGIQISASHNPPEYNGLKLFGPEGRVISQAAGERVREAYRSGSIAWVGHRQVGHVQKLEDTTSRHLELVLATVDVAAIRARRFHVLLDANHGSGSILGRLLLDVLGCKATILGGRSDGKFAHPPEPTAENLEGVRAEVTRCGAQAGFCQDPDADRLAIIDADGRYLGEEYTLALCVDHVLRSRRGPIVTNCSTSRMSEDLAANYGAEFFRSKVGEANVADLMLRCGAVLGGEGNGGVIDPRVGLVRDSFLGMALVLDAMAARGLPIAQLASELPRYEMHKTKVTLDPTQIPAALSALEKALPDAQLDRLDGVRFDWPGKWLLVRSSNTEPIVRIMAEAVTLAEAQELCNRAAAALQAS